MLHDFLEKNEVEILAMTEKKSRDLAENGPSSEQLKAGLPIFYRQLINVLEIEQNTHPEYQIDKAAMAQAARDSDERAMSVASGRKDEVEVATTAGKHGVELLRLGYTLSHVVHAYGAMCQSITELATTKNVPISTMEFHDLNQCLDVAMAGAVTAYASQRTSNESSREVQHLGSLAHELRNALNSATMAFELIKEGSVSPRGNTGQVLERGLMRLDELIDRSLTEVRLKVDPKILVESACLLQLVDPIVLTARIDTRLRRQSIDIRIDPTLIITGDQQLIHSALSNLIQNAVKFTRDGGKIQVRGYQDKNNIVVEVEDQCGGLAPNAEQDLFKPFEQQNKDRKGLGLGLTITQRAVVLNHGTINVRNLPGQGCIFKITLPTNEFKHTATTMEH